MNSLPLIPTPPAQRWKDFRLHGLPVIAFALVTGAIVFLWNHTLAPGTFTGEVQAVQENVASSKPGQLVDLSVELFQSVKAGDVIVRVITTDPKVIEASLAVIRAEVELLKTGMDPILNQHRDAVNYQQFRLSWLAQRVDLAAARVRLQFAESELQRVAKLFEEKIVPLGNPQGPNQNGVVGYEVALRDRDALSTEVEERTKLVTEMEQKLHDLKVPAEWENPQATSPAISAAIAVQDEKLRLTEAQMSPSTLKAHLDGVVHKIYHRSGETIVAGDPIVTLTAPRAQRIIGYLRQPLPFEPKSGDPVKIYTRRPHRQVATTQIIQVGAQMELVTAPMRIRGLGTAMERGLPVLLSLPPGLELHPGELVDLMFNPTR
jgi:multidrug resistance efflux pump